MRLSKKNSNPPRFLTTLRILNGFTQAELGQILCRSQTYISRLERGEITPTREEAQTLARVLKVGAADLFPELFRNGGVG